MDVKDPLPAVADKLNQLLPDDIRVYGVAKATKRFDCKNRVRGWRITDFRAHGLLQCDSRLYEYLLPSLALAPKDQVRTAVAHPS